MYEKEGRIEESACFTPKETRKLSLTYYGERFNSSSGPICGCDEAIYRV